MKELEEKLKPILEKKEYWKAKQILRSRIKNSDRYNPELFGLYGKVLAKMQDDMEAGKYFFLSNLRGPDYDDKIRLFLARYTNTKNKRCVSLTCQFPGIARYRKIEDFPEPTRSDIIKLGLKPDASPEKEASVEKIKSNIIDALIFILIIMVLVSIPIGIVTIWKWIITAIF
jgi:hypothetical protein